MPDKKLHPFIFTLNFIIFAIILLFDTIGAIDISIKSASPLLCLPLLCGYAIFASVQGGAFAGFIIGAMLDGTASGSYCFNTVCFMLLGVFVSLAANNLFNKNIRAAVALSLITAAIYFTARWLCFMAFGVSIRNSLTYLLNFALPSAVYSAIFIFPFFYVYRHFNNLKN